MCKLARKLSPNSIHPDPAFPSSVYRFPVASFLVYIMYSLLRLAHTLKPGILSAFNFRTNAHEKSTVVNRARSSSPMFYRASTKPLTSFFDMKKKKALENRTRFLNIFTWLSLTSIAEISVFNKDDLIRKTGWERFKFSILWYMVSLKLTFVKEIGYQIYTWYGFRSSKTLICLKSSVLHVSS